jgi:hypothetical protein
MARIEGAPNACITGSCLAHRKRVFWQSAERRWVHLNCFPCEPGRAVPAAAVPVRADGALFGAEAVVGLGQLPGQRSLFAGGA